MSSDLGSSAFTLNQLLLFIAIAIILILLLSTWFFSKANVFRYRQKPIMSANELEFFNRLLAANPNGFVFPQVAMSGVIEPVADEPKARLAAFARISQKRIDYLLYTENMQLICIVELDDKTHNAKKDAIRDSYTNSAGIITIRWESKYKPSVSEIKRAITPLYKKALKL